MILSQAITVSDPVTDNDSLYAVTLTETAHRYIQNTSVKCHCHGCLYVLRKIDDTVTVSILVSLGNDTYLSRSRAAYSQLGHFQISS